MNGMVVIIMALRNVCLSVLVVSFISCQDEKIFAPMDRVAERVVKDNNFLKPIIKKDDEIVPPRGEIKVNERDSVTFEEESFSMAGVGPKNLKFTFYIDDSPSMGNDQASLKKNFGVFIDSILLKKGIKYSLAVVDNDDVNKREIGSYHGGIINNDHADFSSSAMDVDSFGSEYHRDLLHLKLFGDLSEFEKKYGPYEYESKFPRKKKHGTPKGWGYAHMMPGSRGSDREYGMNIILNSMKKAVAFKESNPHIKSKEDIMDIYDNPEAMAELNNLSFVENYLYYMADEEDKGEETANIIVMVTDFDDESIYSAKKDDQGNLVDAKYRQSKHYQKHMHKAKEDKFEEVKEQVNDFVNGQFAMRDEDENLVLTDGLKKTLKKLGTNPDYVRVDSVVNLPASYNNGTASKLGKNETYGQRYIWLSEATGGKVHDIDGDYGKALSSMVDDYLGMLVNTVTLSSLVDPNYAVKIYINGAKKELDSEDYTLTGANKTTIVLNYPNMKADDKIDVKYVKLNP